MKRTFARDAFYRMVTKEIRVFRGDLEVSAEEVEIGLEAEYLGRTYAVTVMDDKHVEMED